MALRFRKTFSVLPGLKINLSKTGLSASVGPRGAKMTVGKRGVHATAGLPGTGLSVTKKISNSSKRRPAAEYTDVIKTVDNEIEETQKKELTPEQKQAAKKCLIFAVLAALIALYTGGFRACLITFVVAFTMGVFIF